MKKILVFITFALLLSLTGMSQTSSRGDKIVATQQQGSSLVISPARSEHFTVYVDGKLYARNTVKKVIINKLGSEPRHVKVVLTYPASRTVCFDFKPEPNPSEYVVAYSRGILYVEPTAASNAHTHGYSSADYKTRCD